MTKKRNPNKGLFGWLWMLANTLGWGLYYLVATAAGWLGYQAYNALNDGSGTGWLAGDSAKIYVGLVIFGILWGVLVGLLQWLALRQQVKVVWKYWLVATTLGMLAYGILREILFGLVNTQIGSGTINLYNILITLAASVPLGIAQWLVLRRHLRLSGLWLEATVIAFGIWPALTTILSKAGVTDFLTRYILSSVMDGLIYGGITLAALRIMSSRPDRQ
mgnify:CR=1 FL=1